MKWGLSLKQDATSADNFYSVAVYYYESGDKAKATKYLEKALQLKPGFELAFLLQYSLIPADKR